MPERIKNPANLLPGVMPAIGGLIKAPHSAGGPQQTLGPVHLRARQITGCSPCVDSGCRGAGRAGMSDERTFSVAAGREPPYYPDAERAALALPEAMPRLDDRPEAISDEIWDAAAKHFDEKQLAALVLWIATTNFF